MAEPQALPFEAPIAGMSLTAEPGNRPWQQPAQHSTVEEAIEYFNKAIELDSQYKDAYHNRGLARSDVGDLASSIEDLSKAIELDDCYWSAYRHRSIVYHMIGNERKSSEDYIKAQTLYEPKD